MPPSLCRHPQPPLQPPPAASAATPSPHGHSCAHGTRWHVPLLRGWRLASPGWEAVPHGWQRAGGVSCTALRRLVFRVYPWRPHSSCLSSAPTPAVRQLHTHSGRPKQASVFGAQQRRQQQRQAAAGSGGAPAVYVSVAVGTAAHTREGGGAEAAAGGRWQNGWTQARRLQRHSACSGAIQLYKGTGGARGSQLLPGEQGATK